MFLLRSFVEVDLLGPFGAGPLLFFSILPRLEGYKRAEKASGRSEGSRIAQPFDLSKEGAVLDQGA